MERPPFANLTDKIVVLKYPHKYNCFISQLNKS